MEFIPFIIWALLLCFILFGIFTRRGRNVMIKLQFGGQVVEDLGVIGNQAALLGNQSVRLLKCRDTAGLDFYVMEIQATAPLAIQFFFVKADSDLVAALNKHVTPARPNVRTVK
jgi:hypothetical protein